MRVDRNPAIDAFWSWWSGARPRVEAWAASSGSDDRVADELTAHVKAIHPQLAWEVGEGRRAAHALTLSAEGDPGLRVLAESWRLRGPGDDEAFEYHASRQPFGGDLDALTLTAAGQRVSLRELRVAVEVDEERRAVDVVLHHPVFASLAGSEHRVVMFVLLDTLVGEDAVESWLGVLEASEEPAPPEAMPGSAFRAVVQELPQRWAEPMSLIGQFTDDDGRRYVAMWDVPRRRWSHPLHDTIAKIRLSYGGRADGLPEQEALVRIQAWEDALHEALGSTGVYLATVTGGGVRDVFYALRGDLGPAREELDAAVRAFGEQASLEVVYDPGWRTVPKF